MIATRRKSRPRRGLRHFRAAFCTTQRTRAGLRSASWAERGNFGRRVVEAEDLRVEFGLWHHGRGRGPAPGLGGGACADGCGEAGKQGSFVQGLCPHSSFLTFRSSLNGGWSWLRSKRPGGLGNSHPDLSLSSILALSLLSPPSLGFSPVRCE